jgi:hypothetical protein
MTGRQGLTMAWKAPLSSAAQVLPILLFVDPAVLSLAALLYGAPIVQSAMGAEIRWLDDSPSLAPTTANDLGDVCPRNTTFSHDPYVVYLGFYIDDHYSYLPPTEYSIYIDLRWEQLQAKLKCHWPERIEDETKLKVIVKTNPSQLGGELGFEKNLSLRYQSLVGLERRDANYPVGWVMTGSLIQPIRRHNTKLLVYVDLPSDLGFLTVDLRILCKRATLWLINSDEPCAEGMSKRYWLYTMGAKEKMAELIGALRNSLVRKMMASKS